MRRIGCKAMDITNPIKPADRGAWRAWLAEHHAGAAEAWVLFDDRPDVPTVAYLDAVEEALCFGWIDSIQKRHSPVERAQRFSPRRKRSPWTELNKARARRLIRLGLMAPAGYATLPDLDAPFVVAEDVRAALQADGAAWARFEQFPALYRQVRVGYVEDGRRDPAEFARRLANLVAKTAAGQMFGNWDDGGRLP